LRGPAYIDTNGAATRGRILGIANYVLQHLQHAIPIQYHLDAAFREPPVSTEQVIHPDRYLAGERPADVPAPQADGPVIDEGAKERILEWIEEARRGGAEVLAGGEEQDGLIRPTVIAKAGADLKVSCDEVFGPVVTVNAVDSLDEAIELANGTRYGLQAGVFTSAIETALRAARALDFGGVTVNEAPTFRTDQMPYGGVKDSGNTREGPHYAVRELTEERLVVLQL